MFDYRLSSVFSRCVAFSVLALTAMLVTSAPAALLNYDPFDYTGTSLSGQNGGFGWSGGWFNTVSTSDLLSNDGISLNYPSTFESPMTTPTSAGSRVSTGGVGANSSRLMSSTVSLAVDGNVLYVSALLQKNTANGGGVNSDNILLEFVDSAGNRRFGVGIEGTGDKPWLNANGSTTAATAVIPGQTYFMVAKIVSSAASLDTAYLKVYTLPGSGYDTQVPVLEPVSWDATLTETTGAILDRIRVRIDNGNTVAAPGEVDDIRIGTDWASVVNPVPEPSTAALLLLSGLTAGVMRRNRQIKA